MGDKETVKKLKKRIKLKSEEIDKFCEDNKLKRDYSRELVTEQIAKKVAKSENGDIIETEMFRKETETKRNVKPISEKRFNELTVEARKNGANILRGTKEVEEHLDSMKAHASTIGDTILFRKEVSVSEVLEETYHFMQIKNRTNENLSEPEKTYVNEIEAQKYLIENVAKYKIPRAETEETEKALKYYEKLLEEYRKEQR
ncbi:MAG: hypothetical protein IJ447_08340 [Clostridia bacterium]|nr:hypothetical protein [Clostridia bacterium]